MTHSRLVIATFFEVEGDLRRQLPASRRAKSLESRGQAEVQPGPGPVGEKSVDRLPIQRVPELVVGRNQPVGEFLNASELNHLLPSGKLVTQFLNLVGTDLQHRGNRPH